MRIVERHGRVATDADDYLQTRVIMQGRDALTVRLHLQLSLHLVVVFRYRVDCRNASNMKGRAGRERDWTGRGEGP